MNQPGCSAYQPKKMREGLFLGLLILDLSVVSGVSPEVEISSTTAISHVNGNLIFKNSSGKIVKSITVRRNVADERIKSKFLPRQSGATQVKERMISNFYISKNKAKAIVVETAVDFLIPKSSAQFEGTDAGNMGATSRIRFIDAGGQELQSVTLPYGREVLNLRTSLTGHRTAVIEGDSFGFEGKSGEPFREIVVYDDQGKSIAVYPASSGEATVGESQLFLSGDGRYVAFEWRENGKTMTKLLDVEMKRMWTTEDRVFFSSIRDSVAKVSWVQSNKSVPRQIQLDTLAWTQLP